MNFIMKAFLKKQLKNVPPEQADMIIALVEKNPALFKKIAEEIHAKVSAGVNQEEAAMAVVKEHENEIKELLK